MTLSLKSFSRSFIAVAALAAVGGCSSPSCQAPSSPVRTQIPAVPCGPEEASIDGTCVDVRRSEIERGCNVLSTGECLYPWPSDVLTRPDASSATGLRLDYKVELVPTNDAGTAFPVDDYNWLDGFSPSSQIRFLFPEGVNPALLPPIDDVARSIDPASSIVLLHAGTGERWLHFAEVDATAPAPDRQAVFVRPMRRLDFGARYIVAVRGLTTASGDMIQPSPVFQALRDTLLTDLPEVEALRDRYDEIFGALEQAGVARHDLQLAWDFTTASEELLTQDVRHVLPDLTARVEHGDLGYTIESVETDPSPELALVIRGTFKVPSYMKDGAQPGATLARGDDGLPAYQELVDAPMVIAVPRGVWDAGAAAPVFLWGHGLMGSGDQVLGIAEAAQGFIGVGTDFWGMSEGDVGFFISELFPQNLQKARAVPERVLQSAFNFTTLGYLMQGALAGDAALSKNGQLLVDPTRLYYMGGSQGGIFGGTLMSIFPNIDRGALVVGGGAYSLMVFRSSNWPQFDSFWAPHHADPVEREFLFSIFQSLWDVSEPATYAERLSDPFPGNQPKRILLVESHGDSQVPNISTEMMARTYGLTMSDPPIHDVHGVPGQAGPIDGSALLQVDTGRLPLPPAGNVPPQEDNGAHGAAADSAAVRQILFDFITTGQVVHHCDGPCDPD